LTIADIAFAPRDILTCRALTKQTSTFCWSAAAVEILSYFSKNYLPGVRSIYYLWIDLRR